MRRLKRLLFSVNWYSVIENVLILLAAALFTAGSFVLFGTGAALLTAGFCVLGLSILIGFQSTGGL